MVTHNRINRALEKKMEAESPLPMHWYDIMLVINRAPGKRARNCDIAETIVTSRSALSRSIDKLEKAGLLKLEACASDGRVQYASLTKKGYETFKKAWGYYRVFLQEEFGRFLGKEDARRLTALLTKLRRLA